MIHLYAKDLQIDNLYSVGRLPESYLVAPNGTLHAVYLGASPQVLGMRLPTCCLEKINFECYVRFLKLC
jgi:hypothetical protein